MARPRAAVLAEFDDALAERVDWEPLAGGGASFRSHRLVQARAGRVVFRATRGAKGFAGLFLGVGVLVLAAFARSVGREPWGVLAVLCFGGVAFLAMGGLVVWRLGRPATFDLLLGFYWKGWRKPTHALAGDPIKDGMSLDDVHALQIVGEDFESENADGQKYRYRSYELNLVLTDGSRVNVVDHGSRDGLGEDARTLATFLDVPLWDAGMV